MPEQTGRLQKLFQDGLGFQRDHKFTDAAKCYQQILNDFPDHLGSLVNMGIILKSMGNYEAAITHYTRAFAIDQNSVAVLANLGNALLMTGRLDEALAAHERVLQAHPDSAEAHFNKGLSLRALGQLSDAIFCFDRALLLQPDYPQAEIDRGFALLMRDELHEGFRALESRWKLPKAAKPDFDTSVWNGQTAARTTILVYTESGMSDALFSLRFCAELKQRGAIVILQCQSDLVPLLQDACPYIDKICGFGDDTPPHDVHVPLLSLPHLLGVTKDEIPNTAYITPQNNDPLPFLNLAKPGLKVGIVWSGQKRSMYDAHRHCHFNDFMRLATVPKTYFFSLQLGEPLKEMHNSGMDGIFEDISQHLTSWQVTAQTIRQLDVVITVDTAVAHLAGAMGVETYVLLPLVSDWRWGLGSNTTPWYPSLKLIRQTAASAWDSVFDAVMLELQEKTKQFT